MALCAWRRASPMQTKAAPSARTALAEALTPDDERELEVAV